MLAIKHHFRAHEDGAPGVDRAMVISKLLEIDRQKSPQPTHQIINHGTMTGTIIQQATSHSQATLTFNPADVKRVVERIKSGMDDLSLSDADKEQLKEDIDTIEPQLRSANPKRFAIAQCLHSMRNILEGAAGSILAAGIVNEISEIMKLLPAIHQ